MRHCSWWEGAYWKKMKNFEKTTWYQRAEVIEENESDWFCCLFIMFGLLFKECAQERCKRFWKSETWRIFEETHMTALWRSVRDLKRMFTFINIIFSESYQFHRHKRSINANNNIMMIISSLYRYTCSNVTTYESVLINFQPALLHKIWPNNYTSNFWWKGILVRPINFQSFSYLRCEGYF